MSFCKIVYVKQRGQRGWAWQRVTSNGGRQSSERTYQLYYECVLAARAKGYSPVPELKCS